MKVVGYSWAVGEAGEAASQTDEGTSSIWKYAKKRRWQAPVQLEDPREAFRDFDHRPRGGDVFRALRPGDILVIPDQSHLFRTASQGLAILHRMKERQLAVHCVSLGGDCLQGRLFETLVLILSPLAEFEIEAAGERLRAAKRTARDSGRYMGGNLPFGHVINSNGNVVPDGTRDRVLKQIVKLRVEGRSLRTISVELRSRGHAISHTVVASLLKSIGYDAADLGRGLRPGSGRRT